MIKTKMDHGRQMALRMNCSTPQLREYSQHMPISFYSLHILPMKKMVQGAGFLYDRGDTISLNIIP